MVLLGRGEGRNAAGSQTMGSKQELPPKFPSALCDRGSQGWGVMLGTGLQPGGRILPIPLRGHRTVGSPPAPSTAIRNQSKWVDADLVLGGWRPEGTFPQVWRGLGTAAEAQAEPDFRHQFGKLSSSMCGKHGLEVVFRRSFQKNGS